jgi:diguanylate cyclase (GGDEF)-like protein/PAS domain S-box-containing protein
MLNPRRLEELTAGEVDSVTNRRGRTVLLRRAQDQLRRDEAFKQAAILNALPANIALLDARGLIISVNEAWQLFAVRNLLLRPDNGLGLNYLEVCERAQGDDAAQAHQAAVGIRSVLAGAAKSFSLEYPCHSPTEQRWFQMLVTPLADQSPHGAVIMHLNISERKRAEQELQASEARFKTIFSQAPLGIAVIDSHSGQFCQANPRFAEITGHSVDELVGNNWMQITHPDDVPADWGNMVRLNSGEISGFQMEKRYLHPDGQVIWIDMTVSKLTDDKQSSPRHLCMIQGITERKKSEHTINRLNRVYAVLSGINALIVRVRERDELFKEACRIAVEAGGFRMAMIAVVAPGTMDLVPIASAGKDEVLLHAIKTLLASRDTAPKTMSARALREKRAVVSNDSQHDPQLAFSPAYAAAGVRAMAVLPLMVANEAVGVLGLYASEPGFFQEEELKLLTELAGDIGFAMDHLDKQERLTYLAYYDALTGLANRTLFLERLAQYKRSATSGGHRLALFLLDLERFKNINDSLGRQVGDELLRQVAQWLTRQATGDANLLARVGADHFAVVMPVIHAHDNVVSLLEQWIDAFLKHPFRLNDGIFRIAVKVGVALFPDDGTVADTLFKHAEAALKKAKASGERYLFFTPTMTQAGPANLTLENQLRQALDNEEFVLYYQPKVNLASGTMTSAEALIRWNDPRTGLVPPARFIPILEETGLIHDVGRWAIRRAIQDYLRWRAAGLPAVRIAVNVSPMQLRDRGFIGELRQALSLNHKAAAGLELEITESLIMENVQHSIASLQAIRDMGLSIAIDDFGTGFSSLSYLSKFPVDTLKIDRSFVIEMTASAQGLALVSTIISLAHALNLKVVAEGVETEEQVSLLRVLNCDEMQGYLFSKPVSAEIFETRFLYSLARPAAV